MSVCHTSSQTLSYDDFGTMAGAKRAAAFHSVVLLPAVAQKISGETLSEDGKQSLDRLLKLLDSKDFGSSLFHTGDRF